MNSLSTKSKVVFIVAFMLLNALCTLLILELNPPY